MLKPATEPKTAYRSKTNSDSKTNVHAVLAKM